MAVLVVVVLDTPVVLRVELVTLLLLHQVKATMAVLERIHRVISTEVVEVVGLVQQVEVGTEMLATVVLEQHLQLVAAA